LFAFEGDVNAYFLPLASCRADSSGGGDRDQDSSIPATHDRWEPPYDSAFNKKREIITLPLESSLSLKARWEALVEILDSPITKVVYNAQVLFCFTTY
jgi:hypothetical protein